MTGAMAAATWMQVAAAMNRAIQHAVMISISGLGENLHRTHFVALEHVRVRQAQAAGRRVSGQAGWWAAKLMHRKEQKGMR